MEPNDFPTKAFLDQLGGYRAVAARLGAQPRRVHNWTRTDKFPLAQYHNLHRLASEDGIEPPDDSLFPFKTLPVQTDNVRAAE